MLTPMLQPCNKKSTWPDVPPDRSRLPDLENVGKC